jgi:hypothetical protein
MEMQEMRLLCGWMEEALFIAVFCMEGWKARGIGEFQGTPPKEETDREGLHHPHYNPCGQSNATP